MMQLLRQLHGVSGQRVLRSTSSPAGDSAKLDVDDAARAFCSAELITLEEMFDLVVLLGCAESALIGKLCTA